MQKKLLEYAVLVKSGTLALENVPIRFRHDAEALLENNLAAVIDYARQEKWSEIKAIRDSKETSGCPFKGSVIDSDERSVTKINTAVQSAQVYGEGFSIDWTMQDNSVMTLSYADMLSVPLALAAWSNYLHQHARQVRVQIDAAEGVADIMAIGWGEEDFDSMAATISLGGE